MGLVFRVRTDRLSGPRPASQRCQQALQDLHIGYSWLANGGVGSRYGGQFGPGLPWCGAGRAVGGA